MSFAEVKQSIREMSMEERLEVAAYIAYLNCADDPAYLAELDRRMAAMDQGRKYTEADLRKLHEDLIKQGR